MLVQERALKTGQANLKEFGYLGARKTNLMDLLKLNGGKEGYGSKNQNFCQCA